MNKICTKEKKTVVHKDNPSEVNREGTEKRKREDRQGDKREDIIGTQSLAQDISETTDNTKHEKTN